MIVDASSLVGISVVALSLVLSPGPNMVYLISRSVTQGRRAGLISLAGVAVGFLAYLTLAVAGLASVFTAFPEAYLTLKLVGAAYLLYLAWKALSPGGTSAFAPGELPPDGPRKLFTMGLVTNLLNPKIAVLYVALLPQFVHPARGWVAVQSAILGATQIGIALTVNCLIVLFAGALSGFLVARPTWLRAQRIFMGLVLAGLAVLLASTPAAHSKDSSTGSPVRPQIGRLGAGPVLLARPPVPGVLAGPLDRVRSSRTVRLASVVAAVG